MNDEKYHKKVDGSHKMYLKYEPVKCPHLNNEEIRFNRHGFNHLERKGKKLRSRKEVLERLKLLPLVTEIISSKNSVCDFRCEQSNSDDIKYWGLTYTLKENLMVRVVIRQIDKGPKHFYSIMRRSKSINATLTTKAPKGF